jgi:hypothetical protein
MLRSDSCDTRNYPSNSSLKVFQSVSPSLDVENRNPYSSTVVVGGKKVMLVVDFLFCEGLSGGKD